jgi:hypothetical protein
MCVSTLQVVQMWIYTCHVHDTTAQPAQCTRCCDPCTTAVVLLCCAVMQIAHYHHTLLLLLLLLLLLQPFNCNVVGLVDKMLGHSWLEGGPPFLQCNGLEYAEVQIVSDLPLCAIKSHIKYFDYKL